MNKQMKLAGTAMGLMLAAGAAQAQVTCGANTGVAATGAPIVDAAALERGFVAWAFGMEAADPGHDAAAEAIAHAQAVAKRFDARRMPRLPALVPQLLAAAFPDVVAENPPEAGNAPGPRVAA
jgi:hypothetical protein